MSRNQHFRMGPPLGTAYGPAAEGSSEGDVLFGLREDDAMMRLGISAYDELRGLREDDASVRLGVSAYDLDGLREDDASVRLGDGRWDGASGSAEGSAEGHAVAQLGISAYDAQPGRLVSDVRIGGMVEDHWNIRMGVSAYDELRGLREDDASVRLGVSAYDLQGLREDDASVRLGGLREDDASVRLGDDELEGLREDDASVRLGTSYAPDAAGSAEVPDWRGGMGVSAYDLGVSAYDNLGVSAYDQLGDVESLNAEAWAIEQMQGLADYEIGKKRAAGIRVIAMQAGQAAYKGAQSGTVTSRAEAEKFIQSKVAAAAARVKQQLQTRLTRVDEIAKDAVKKAMEKWSPLIDKVLAKKTSVQGVRMGYILRGLREDDASVRLGDLDDEMGRRRAFNPMRRHRRMLKRLTGAETSPPEMLAAEGFHERFPVRVDIAGLGVIHGSVTGGQMSGLFDFLKPAPSAEEYMGKIRIVLDGWRVAKPQLEALSTQAKTSIINQMTALNNEPAKYESMNGFLAEGYAAYTDGRYDRVKRLEAYLPTVQKMITEARALGGNFTIDQANKVAAEDLKSRQEAAGQPTLLEKAAPIAAGVGAAGLFTALIIAIA